MSRKPRQHRGTSNRRANTVAAVTSIRRLFRVLRVVAQRTQATAGISAAQHFVLQQLGGEISLSLTELATRTVTDRSSVAAVVDRLCEQGLADRSIDPRDRRRAAIRITRAGRRVLARSADAPATVLFKALRSLDERRLAVLATSLQSLVRALGATHEPASLLFSDDGARRQNQSARATR